MHSFLEMVPVILKIPGVSVFLSEKVSQDPLEKHFGRLRQQGRTNENPTVVEALKSTQTLRVINGVWVDDITGNTRGKRKKFLDVAALDEKLPKRKR